MIIALDSETAGLDIYHGAKPFIVTTCQMNGKQLFWEWYVDPLTRNPIILEEDIEEIRQLINNATEIVGQNFKFDMHAISRIIPDIKWDWDKINDCTIAAHVLKSNQLKDLGALSYDYLGESIQEYENRVEKKVKEAYTHVRKHFTKWRIAKRGMEDIPSAKLKVWKFDMWLPRALAFKREFDPSSSEFKVTHEYANKDSENTLKVWKGNSRFEGLEKQLKDRGLWKHYRFRVESVRIAQSMERTGVTHSKKRTEEIRPKYVEESNRIKRECVSIAERLGHDLVMPKKGMNDNLRKFFNDVLRLPPVFNKKGIRTYDKQTAMPFYLDTLSSGSDELKFIENMIEKSNFDTSLAYLNDYNKYSLKTDDPNTLLLHPNVNPTGSKTLRWSHNNPNSANVSKQKDKEGYSLRYCFGPGPGREWWSADARNVELRLPFYESGEPEMIDLFEKSEEPPYYGSNHILIFSVLWEELWHKAVKEVGIKEAGPYCKDKYKADYYQWTKNFNFAVQYGSGKQNADRTAHRPGAYDLVSQRFSKLSTLNKRCIDFANKHSYIETLPDRTVDSSKGYPLQCTMMDYGKVLTTIPLSYRVQGSAMWLTSSAMIKVDQQLEEWRKQGFDAFITLQIHDELVFDLPKRSNPKENPRQSNLGRMRVIQRLLESCGYDFVPSIPVPFSLGYHENNWAKELAF